MKVLNRILMLGITLLIIGCKDIKPDVPANKIDTVGVDAGESDMGGIFSGDRGAFAFEMDLNKKGSLKYLNGDDEKKKEMKKTEDLANNKNQEVGDNQPKLNNDDNSNSSAKVLYSESPKIKKISIDQEI